MFISFQEKISETLLHRWVTLQPDSDYNPREKCKEKRKLDLEGITKEIVDEISDNRRWSQNFILLILL